MISFFFQKLSITLSFYNWLDSFCSQICTEKITVVLSMFRKTVPPFYTTIQFKGSYISCTKTPLDDLLNSVGMLSVPLFFFFFWGGGGLRWGVVGMVGVVFQWPHGFLYLFGREIHVQYVGLWITTAVITRPTKFYEQSRLSWLRPSRCEYFNRSLSENPCR